jgi:hypothetical protein
MKNGLIRTTCQSDLAYGPADIRRRVWPTRTCGSRGSEVACRSGAKSHCKVICGMGAVKLVLGKSEGKRERERDLKERDDNGISQSVRRCRSEIYRKTFSGQGTAEFGSIRISSDKSVPASVAPAVFHTDNEVSYR